MNEPRRLWPSLFKPMLEESEMTPEELQQWLEEHIHEIFAFMDYEPTLDSDEAFARTLASWFGREDWNEAGYRFVHLGIDGMGGQFAAWIRPGLEGPAPVVYFGSEGGRGVMTRSSQAWAAVLAHAPGIDEYPTLDDPARLDLDLNWKLDDEVPEARAAAEGGLADYRAAVVERFGKIEAFEALTEGLDGLNKEFCGWITKTVGV